MPANTALTSRRLGAVLASAALALGLTAGPLALTAHAEGTASTVVADGNLAKDGTLSVTETITFSGNAPRTVTQRFETRENLLGDRQYVQTLSKVSATAQGAPVDTTVTPDGRFTTVTVASAGAAEVVLSYTVTGAVVPVDAGTALRWPMLQGLSAQVTDFRATVQIPTQFSYVRCTAGSPNSTVPCTSAAAGLEGSQVPTFRDGPRGESEFVTVDIGFPAGAMPSNEQVEYRWTLGRAFSVTPLPLAVALGLLVLGAAALLLAHRRTGRDAEADGQLSRVGEFVPTGPGQSEFRVVDEIRPGHIGTVADENVDPIDVTATVLDLAVRGHLLITELPRSSAFAPADWELTRLTSQAPLRPFETLLLDGVAPVGGRRLVSQLSGPVGEVIGDVQDALYDEVVTHGWFERRPDATRDRWTQLALLGLILAVAATGVLVAFTTFGLAGLVLVALALGATFVAQEAPARTRAGAALLAGLGVLRSDLLSHPTDQMPPHRTLQEISEVLPYAVVLGGTDRWLDALAAGDDDTDPDSTDLSWYHGPQDWHLRDLPDSLRSLVTTMSGNLFAR
ncbi:MAG: hypothetical protein JWP61_307 [Friedmanniella sp.]|nr:hypothetical protein [Friedmanniella sp.]